jgi:hypothetical protein
MRAMGLGAPPASPNAPVLSLGQDQPLAPGQTGAQTTQGWCRSDRVTLAGGMMNTLLVHPSVTPFERLWRKLPEEGMFHPDVSPQEPFVGEIGAFKVEGKMALLIFDLRPDIYRLSGVDAGDYVPVEARRFNGQLGFDLTVERRRDFTNMEFQLDPVPFPRGGTAAFQAAPGTSDFFTAAQIGEASSFGSVAGTGSALQPQRPVRPGAPSIPYTIIVKPGQIVQLQIVVFRPLQSPIAFIEYDLAGLYMPIQWLNATLECLKPVADIPR